MLDMAKRYDARILIASTSGKSSVRLTRSTITDLLFLSPSEVYGDPEVHPQPENYNGSVPSYGPRACYDEGKRVSEALAYAYQESERVDVRIARIFDTYGERMALDDGRVVSNFIIAALTNQDLVITGDGTATRSFCHVSDLVRGLMRLMVGDYTGPVNLGTPEEYSIKELADMILDIVHTEDKGLFRTNIVYLPAPMHDPRRRCPDISLAYRLMWWSPSVTVREGLERTINHFRTHINSMQAMDLDLMIHSANVVAALHDEAADAGDEGVVLAAPAPESADSSDVELD
ncbi:MAG: hypothetical protein M1833_005275 [Piccolia ochrophora]|nr:MAG: hypothetical protein M1833_005275 [Piccolia ochrophora]